MNTKKMNELVGKSFEDLTMDEMRDMQGAGDATVDSTPTVVASAVSAVEVSKAVSVILSVLSAATITIEASKKANCRR